MYDSSKINANNLFLNLTGITFIQGGSVVFSGRDAVQGGNAGILEVSLPPYILFNTTRANFTGLGGYSTGVGNSGGNGGTLKLNYWGKIRNFSDFTSSLEFPPAPDNTPRLTAGNSSESISGIIGKTIFNKDINSIPRDVDINDDGLVDSSDYVLIKNNYNQISSDLGFNLMYDINSDNKLNVIDISRIGFNWHRGY